MDTSERSSATWPDPLVQPVAARVARLLVQFWEELGQLPDLLGREEQLLCAAATARLRDIVIEMMLALNGIAYPQGTRHLNHYLGASQRAALEKTLAAPVAGGDAWLGQAVALVVIYRWYAPQLVARFDLAYPQAVEEATLAQLAAALPDWPLAIQTD